MDSAVEAHFHTLSRLELINVFRYSSHYYPEQWENFQIDENREITQEFQSFANMLCTITFVSKVLQHF